MEHKLDTAEKKVLVDLVKLSQKRGMKGSSGGWKEFLHSRDRKFGASLSDPAKRSTDVLASFLKTFTEQQDLKFFAKILQCHSNRDIVEKFRKESPDKEFPEQRLVLLTFEHPQYPLDYTFPSHSEEWVVTKLGKKSKGMTSSEMIAVDCEMVLCEDGTEAIVRVCVVNRKLEVKLDEYVNPKKAVADYRTEITGVTAKDIEKVTCSLADIQKSINKLLSHGTILVGHSLNNDLQALKIDHPRVIDTSFIFKYEGAPMYKRPSLDNLCKSVLGYELRKKGAPHDCVQDATAAMKLVLAAVKQGVDTIIPSSEDVAALKMAKLLLHRIPKNVPCEELHRILPGDFTVEVKPSKKAQGGNYSALVTFPNPQEACCVFENLKGILEKDSSGLPQKLVTFKLSSGLDACLYVRKMVRDNDIGQVLGKKRALRDKEHSDDSEGLETDRESEGKTRANTSQNDEDNNTNALKRQKVDHKSEEKLEESINQCEDHLKEIERLKKELREKDFQLSMQDKIISDLKKKVEKLKDLKKKAR